MSLQMYIENGLGQVLSNWDENGLPIFSYENEPFVYTEEDFENVEEAVHEDMEWLASQGICTRAIKL